MMQPRVVVTFFNDAHTFHAFHAFSTLFRCPKRSINDAHLEIYPRHYEISTQHPRVPISLAVHAGRAGDTSSDERVRSRVVVRVASARTNERTNERTDDRLSVFAVARREVSRRLVGRARGPEDGRALQFPRRIALSRSAIARSRSFAGVLAIARRARGRDRA